MPSNELEPFKVARLDQWNTFLNEVVGHTVIHLTAGNCAKHGGTCIGGASRDILDGLTAIETEMLLEIAILRLAQLQKAEVW